MLAALSRSPTGSNEVSRESSGASLLSRTSSEAKLGASDHNLTSLAFALASSNTSICDSESLPSLPSDNGGSFTNMSTLSHVSHAAVLAQPSCLQECAELRHLILARAGLTVTADDSSLSTGDSSGRIPPGNKAKTKNHLRRYEKTSLPEHHYAPCSFMFDYEKALPSSPTLSIGSYNKGSPEGELSNKAPTMAAKSDGSMQLSVRSFSNMPVQSVHEGMDIFWLGKEMYSKLSSTKQDTTPSFASSVPDGITVPRFTTDDCYGEDESMGEQMNDNQSEMEMHESHGMETQDAANLRTPKAGSAASTRTPPMLILDRSADCSALALANASSCQSKLMTPVTSSDRTEGVIVPCQSKLMTPATSFDQTVAVAKVTPPSHHGSPTIHNFTDGDVQQLGIPNGALAPEAAALRPARFSPSDEERIHVNDEDIADDDIYCGQEYRGSAHPGNVAFRLLMQENKEEYASYGNRHGEKTKMSLRILENEITGRFVEMLSDGEFYLKSKKEARKKVGQGLREK